MNLIAASEWGRQMRPGAPRMNRSQITEMTVHYTGARRVDRSPEQIASYIKAIERSHMGRGQGMSGIGYNFAVDKWGRIWELRGWTYKNAANGTKSNNTSFSVNCLVGVEDNEPTPEMVAALQSLHAEAVRRFGRPIDVRGHQEHKPTACPGGALMALVRSGRIQNERPDVTPVAPQPAQPTQQGSLTGIAAAIDAARQQTLRRGSKGDAVVWLQLFLSKHGIRTTVDGDFGPRTEESVRSFQRSRWLTVDGVVGPVTWKALLG